MRKRQRKKNEKKILAKLAGDVSCGSLTQTISVDVHESITVREKIRKKHRRHGHKKPISESMSGDDLHSATGQWNQLTREIDRENNRYREIIINQQSGEVIRECDEPLTNHTGRGSAKSKPTRVLDCVG